ncbi:SPFH domain-containing protein [archaeon]
MPKFEDITAIRPAGKKPRGKEVGSFLLILVLAVLGIFVLYALGVITELILLAGLLVVLFYIYSNTPPFLIELEQYERAVILRYGKFLRVAGPGWVFLAPFIDDARIVDQRVVVVDIEPQEVLSKDNIKLHIDGIIYMSVKDAEAAVINIKNPVEAATTYVRAHLRDIIGKMELEAVISDIHVINELLRAGLAKMSKEWGVDVAKVEIQSIELPDVVMDAMHDRKAAEQKKYATEELAKAQAIKIDAIRKAAGQLNDPAIQYLYLQALEKVAEGKSSKIIFPLELTHLASRLSGNMNPNQRAKFQDDMVDNYNEFMLEETRDGVPISRTDILNTLKRKARRKLKKEK